MPSAHPIPPNPACRAPLRTPLRTLPTPSPISTPTGRTSPPPPNPAPTLLAFAPPLRRTAHPILLAIVCRFGDTQEKVVTARRHQGLDERCRLGVHAPHEPESACDGAAAGGGAVIFYFYSLLHSIPLALLRPPDLWSITHIVISVLSLDPDVLLDLKRPSAPYTGVDPLAHAYPAMHMAQRGDRGYCCVVYYHLVPFHERSWIFTHSFPSFSSPRACIDHPPKQDEQAALAPLTIWPMYTMRGISPHRTTPSLHLLPAHDIALLLSSRSFPHPPSPHKFRLSHAILDARTAFLDAYSFRPTHPLPSPP
ncbi:hypothetical protein FB45DRAFT_1023900 [Roridomyces roridus]|uniref:Uncharacterized protein n=1 Tax=Roridomyces roridus TaxID=1738132 RepID=A0AAD7C524_9AGAR|nr:hypothetical protein FB45DRAFT_1023900 [Roridomyces roridus]